MKRKPHWIQDLIPVNPSKRTRVLVKPVKSKPIKSDHWRAKMQDFYTDLNINTLETVPSIGHRRKDWYQLGASDRATPGAWYENLCSCSKVVDNHDKNGSKSLL